MNWQRALIALAIGYIGFLLLLCAIGWAIDECKKSRTRRLLKRLNSPFFRNVYDAHYRAAKLN